MIQVRLFQIGLKNNANLDIIRSVPLGQKEHLNRFSTVCTARI